MVSTLNINAVGLGNGILYQSYFVCVKESPEGTLIEYGKSQGFTKNRDVFLTMNDTQNPFYSRFYSFGNGEDPVQVVDVHVLSRRLSNVKCRGDTKLDEKTNLCVQDCHELCDPAQGMQKNKTRTETWDIGDLKRTTYIMYHLPLQSTAPQTFPAKTASYQTASYQILHF